MTTIATEIWVALIGGGVTVLVVIIRALFGRRRAKVRVYMWPGPHVDQQGGPPETVYFLEATNTGGKVISLSSAYVRLPESVTIDLLTPSGQFPFSLKSGTVCRMWLKEEYLNTVLAREFLSKQHVEMIGGFIDSTGKRHETEPRILDRQESIL